MNQTDQAWRRWINWDQAALAALALAAWMAAGFLLRDDVYLLGDHPGHYWWLWYTLNVALPLHHRFLDWIPYWYAGYPEMQFYPPGFVILGWLFNLLAFGRLSAAWIYEVVIFFSYAMPAFTFYYALRHLGFGVRAAFAAGLFALVFPTFVGGADGAFIGMTGSRMAFGLNALVFAWGVDVVHARGLRYALLFSSAMALAILSHPLHEVGIFIALCLYTFVQRLPLVSTGMRLVIPVLLAAAFDAFWILPLFVHISTSMVPIIRTTFDQTWRELTSPVLVPYAILSLPALTRIWREPDKTKRGILLSLVTLAVILPVIIVVDYLVLVERFSLYPLDPVRISGEYYFAIVVLAAAGLSTVSDWVAGWRWFGKSRTLAGAVAVLLCLSLWLPFSQSSIANDPQKTGEPLFLSQATGDYKLNELWDALRADDGRVLFASFYTQLTAHGSAAVPTTLTSLTPLFTNRQIMGGTFSHWSPIAALMWVGSLQPGAMKGASEDNDDTSLFGIPFDKLTAEQVYQYCQAFNITTIVATVNDYNARQFLDASSHFQSFSNNGFFFIYRVTDNISSWVDARNATVQLKVMTDDWIDLEVPAAQADSAVRLKIYGYPLWRAYTSDGRQLALTQDDLGLAHLALTPGRNYSVQLRYEEGGVEQLGRLITGMSVTLAAAVAIHSAIKATRARRVDAGLSQGWGR